MNVHCILKILMKNLRWENAKKSRWSVGKVKIRAHMWGPEVYGWTECAIISGRASEWQALWWHHHTWARSLGTVYRVGSLIQSSNLICGWPNRKWKLLWLVCCPCFWQRHVLLFLPLIYFCLRNKRNQGSTGIMPERFVSSLIFTVA